jgi:hypothetical protein
MITLDDVGAFASAPTGTDIDVRFGIYLPGIDPQAGYEVMVRVIHKDDRFVPAIQTMDFPLSPIAGTPNNLWQTQVTIPFLSVPLPTSAHRSRNEYQAGDYPLVYRSLCTGHRYR